MSPRCRLWLKPWNPAQAFPDVSKAKSAIQNVFGLIDSRPKNIDVEAPGERPGASAGRLLAWSFPFPGC